MRTCQTGVMAKIKFTKKSVSDLKPQARPYAVTDATTERGIGFQVRVFPNGRKAYQVRFRASAGGPETLQTIGSVEEIELADARDRAREIVRRGKLDPEAATSAMTWSEAVDIMEKLKLTGGGKAEILRTLRRECAAWNARRVRSITKSDVKTVLNAIENRKKFVQRNRTLTYMKIAFKYFIERGYSVEDPTDGSNVNRKYEKPPRRALSVQELQLVWRAAFAIDEGERRRGVWGDLFAILILTGARLSEVAEMTVDEVDITKSMWEVPASRMKAAEPHAVPLAPVPLAILSRRVKAAIEAGEKLVFTSNGTSPPSGWSKIKKQIDAKIAELNSGKPIPPWRIHSIRHGFRSALSQMQIPPHIAERCIAHKPRGIEGLYDHHDYIQERRVALAEWAKEVKPGDDEHFGKFDLWTARGKEQRRLGDLRNKIRC